MDESSAEVTSKLVDLRGLTLADVGSCPATAFASSLDPLMHQIDHPTRSIGGHNS